MFCPFAYFSFLYLHASFLFVPRSQYTRRYVPNTQNFRTIIPPHSAAAATMTDTRNWNMAGGLVVIIIFFCHVFLFSFIYVLWTARSEIYLLYTFSIYESCTVTTTMTREQARVLQKKARNIAGGSLNILVGLRKVILIKSQKGIFGSDDSKRTHVLIFFF